MKHVELKVNTEKTKRTGMSPWKEKNILGNAERGKKIEINPKNT